MRYYFTFFTSVAVATTFQAAPLPKELKVTALERLYGKPVDDSGKCEFTLDAAVSHGATCEGTTAETPSRLRLIRKGDSITSSESRDGGKTWQPTGKIEGKLAKELQVGVVAVNATKRKAEIIFDSFEVTQK